MTGPYKPPLHAPADPFHVQDFSICRTSPTDSDIMCTAKAFTRPTQQSQDESEMVIVLGPSFQSNTIRVMASRISDAQVSKDMFPSSSDRKEDRRCRNPGSVKWDRLCKFVILLPPTWDQVRRGLSTQFAEKGRIHNAVSPGTTPTWVTEPFHGYSLGARDPKSEIHASPLPYRVLSVFQISTAFEGTPGKSIGPSCPGLQDLTSRPTGVSSPQKPPKNYETPWRSDSSNL